MLNRIRMIAKEIIVKGKDYGSEKDGKISNS